jgi:cytochrome oxidase Cu insertion factor (SCO1/SenC/PrrC family)
MVENFRVVRARFADVMDRDLVLLTISFDPQYDTPERLAAYAAANRAVAPGWLFLTGERSQIERVCDARTKQSRERVQQTNLRRPWNTTRIST